MRLFSMSKWLYIALDKQEVSGLNSMDRVHVLLLSLFLVFSLVIVTLADQDANGDDDDNSCVYMIYVQTGSKFFAGTDSIISLKLFNVYDETVSIDNLVKWGGIMGPQHDYFEIGNLDIFSGRGKCLVAPVCAMNVTSDGSGSFPGWYCEYVQVTSAEPNSTCTKRQFKVQQWLVPDSLTVTTDNCFPSSVRDSSRVKSGWGALSYVA